MLVLTQLELDFMKFKKQKAKTVYKYQKETMKLRRGLAQSCISKPMTTASNFIQKLLMNIYYFSF